MSSERNLRQLELLVLRRLDGMLQGDYRGLFKGPGTEAGDSRLYGRGDDVRRMDWSLTARTAVPHVRDTIADRELEVWIVFDESPSLAFGSTGGTKRDLALAAVAAVGFLTARAGNRVGAVAFGGGHLRMLPARTGRDGVLALLRDLASGSEPDHVSGGRSGRARRAVVAEVDGAVAAIERVRRLARHHGLVALVSDFLVDEPWEDPLRALRARHDLLALEIVDPRELELPRVGVLTLVDPETGRRIDVQTSDDALRARFHTLAAAERAATAAALRHGGIDHVVLSTDADWMLELVRFVARRRRFGAVRPGGVGGHAVGAAAR